MKSVGFKQLMKFSFRRSTQFFSQFNRKKMNRNYLTNVCQRKFNSLILSFYPIMNYVRMNFSTSHSISMKHHRQEWENSWQFELSFFIWWWFLKAKEFLFSILILQLLFSSAIADNSFLIQITLMLRSTTGFLRMIDEDKRSVNVSNPQFIESDQ